MVVKQEEQETLALGSLPQKTSETLSFHQENPQLSWNTSGISAAGKS